VMSLAYVRLMPLLANGSHGGGKGVIKCLVR